jgi:hypothetical protein
MREKRMQTEIQNMEDDENTSNLDSIFVKLMLSKVCLETNFKDKASIRDFILKLCGNELRPLYIDLNTKNS